ncbi:MAG: c-type cytochrome [Alphaproteobacteria bacterium]|nr:MAG: c-type cytochrome [Alphaproteobacteria bacterium]
MKRLLGSGVAIAAAGGIAVVLMAADVAPTYQPPAESEMPTGKFGDEVKLGEAIFREPQEHAAEFVGNTLRCSNCHLQAGRLAGAAPMGPAYVSYPAYRSKNGHVNSFEERLQGCFEFSMNGKAPPLGDKVLVALESYSYWLAKGLKVDEKPPGRGFPALEKAALTPDYARGAQVYSQHCAMCHGGDGAGQSSGGKVVFPALWGTQSFNWGAGMGSIKNAAEFIHANMPLGMGGSLSPQQSWDVATYMDSQVRPQDPRFINTVEETRAKFHDSASSMYGKTVNGAVLGDPAVTPPAGTVPGPAKP